MDQMRVTAHRLYRPGGASLIQRSWLKLQLRALQRPFPPQRDRRPNETPLAHPALKTGSITCAMDAGTALSPCAAKRFHGWQPEGLESAWMIAHYSVQSPVTSSPRTCSAVKLQLVLPRQS